MPTVKMNKQGDGFFRNTQITVDPTEVEKYKAQGFTEELPAVTPPSTQMPVVENPLGLSMPEPAVVDKTQLTPDGRPIPPPPPPPAKPEVLQPQLPSMTPGATFKSGEQVQVSQLAPKDRKALDIATQEQVKAAGLRNEASMAASDALKAITGDNIELMNKSVGALDKQRMDLSDEQVQAQTDFLREQAAKRKQAEDTPPPQRRDWWDASTTGQKVAAGIAAILGLIAQSKTGDSSAINALVKNMHDTVDADLENQKLRYQSEKDKIASHKEMNDLRTQSYRNSFGAIESKRSIVADKVNRDATLAIQRNPNLNDAQKAEMLAKLKEEQAKIVADGLEKTASKISTGTTYSVAQPKAGISLKDQQEVIQGEQKILNPDQNKARMNTYLANREQLSRVDNILKETDPAKKAAAAAEIADFIATGLGQGSFTTNMTGVALPDNVVVDLQKKLQYIMANPQGTATDEQLKGIQQFLRSRVESTAGHHMENMLIKSNARLQSVGASLEDLGIGMGKASDQVSSWKPVKK